MTNKSITIIGAGFGAISAIKNLRKMDKELEINLISSSTDFVYLPSLIWIPTKLRKPAEISVSLTGFLKSKNVKHIKAHVRSISDDGREVFYDGGSIKNDALIIASGGRFLKSAKGIEHTFTLCDGLASSQAISDKLQNMHGGSISFGFAGNPKEVTALRGGPIFELMFGIETYLRKHKKRDNFQINFFSPAPKPGIRLGEKAYEGLISMIAKRNIKIASLGSKIIEFQSAKVILENSEFNSDLTIFMPGLTGPIWLENTSLPLSEGGMIKVDKCTRVIGYRNTYAIGDCASFQSPDWAPKQAHMADLQGKAAAINCFGDLNNIKANNSFEWELMCIIDTLDGGTLVYRSEKHSFVISSYLLHWAKRIFEKLYIIALR